MQEDAFVQAAYNNCQDVIKIIDQKAMILVGALAVLAAVQVAYGNDLACAWDDAPHWLTWTTAILLTASGLSMVTGYVAAIIALLPRRPDEVPFAADVDPRLGHLLWAHSINDRSRYNSFESYRDAIRSAPNDLRTDELIHQTMAVANIVVAKFRWSQCATVLFIVASALLGLAAVAYPYVHSLIPVS